MMGRDKTYHPIAYHDLSNTIEHINKIHYVYILNSVTSQRWKQREREEERERGMREKARQR